MDSAEGGGGPLLLEQKSDGKRDPEDGGGSERALAIRTKGIKTGGEERRIHAGGGEKRGFLFASKKKDGEARGHLGGWGGFGSSR